MDRLRQQTVVSLNLKVREQERTALDKERLARENARRAAHGLKPLATIEEINDNEAADVVLTEASQIVADMTSVPLVAQAAKGS